MGSSATSQTIWGFIFIIFGSVSFAGFLYAAVILKLLPPSDNPFLSYIQRDRYSSCLTLILKNACESLKLLICWFVDMLFYYIKSLADHIQHKQKMSFMSRLHYISLDFLMWIERYNCWHYPFFFTYPAKFFECLFHTVSSVMKGRGELMKCKNGVDIAAWLAIGNQDASFIYPNIGFFYCSP